MSEILEQDLSYNVRGVLIEVSNKYGHLHKEQVYQKACEEVFVKRGIKFRSHPKLSVHSIDSGKKLGMYVPDFLIEDKIVVELKAQPVLPRISIQQLEQYLKASKYEIGFAVNFGEPRVRIVRRIYTNDLKPFIRALSVSYL